MLDTLLSNRCHKKNNGTWKKQVNTTVFLSKIIPSFPPEQCSSAMITRSLFFLAAVLAARAATGAPCKDLTFCWSPAFTPHFVRGTPWKDGNSGKWHAILLNNSRWCNFKSCKNLITPWFSWYGYEYTWIIQDPSSRVSTWCILFFCCIGSACPSQHLEAPCEAIQEGRVLIVGSGISGLVAAVSLRHHGVLTGDVCHLCTA